MNAKNFLKSLINEDTGAIDGYSVSGDLFAMCTVGFFRELTLAVNLDIVLTESQQRFVCRQLRSLIGNALRADISFSSSQSHCESLWHDFSNPKIVQLATYINSCR